LEQPSKKPAQAGFFVSRLAFHKRQVNVLDGGCVIATPSEIVLQRYLVGCRFGGLTGCHTKRVELSGIGSDGAMLALVLF